MKLLKLVFIACSIAFCFTSITYSQDASENFPKLSGPYLGQKPPGMTPEIFAPGILNTNKMAAFGVLFSTDVNEFYTVRFEREQDKVGGIVVMRKENNQWSPPELLPFDAETWDNDMVLSEDGSLFIFRTFRDFPDREKKPNEAFIWYVTRIGKSWSGAKPLLCGGEPLSTHYPSLTSNNNLYFKYRSGDKFGIFRSVQIQGEFGKPEHVYTAVDTLMTESDVFVAPDESYMIITCYNHPDNVSKRRDLYIVFRDDTGKWTEELNMGTSINTDLKENCPYVSPDGKYLFFYRYNSENRMGNIYWVDAKIIDDLRARVLK